jgi:uncharacterized Ntn-hydrolase superfamily protein
MTWSILARDARTGEVGGAVATKFFAVGALCLRAEGRVGIAATQALVNPMLAPAALGHLRAGAAPEAAVRAAVEADPGRRARQLHVLGRTGRRSATRARTAWSGRGTPEGRTCPSRATCWPGRRWWRRR